MKWYLVRYEKLFIPYLVTFVPIVLCQILMGNPPAHGFFDYVLYITSLRFYISHDAPWFVAALIPLYLLSPLFFVYMKKCRWLALTTISLLLWGIQLIPAITNSEVFDNFLLNLQFVSVRATCFVLGMALGQDIQNGVHLRTSVLVILVVIGVLVFALFKHLVYSYYFFSLPMLFLMVSILKRCKRYLVSVIRRIGEISLESYLFNLALPNIIVFLFILIGIQSLGNIMPYIIACVIGVVLGYISRKLSVKILEIVIK